MHQQPEANDLLSEGEEQSTDDNFQEQIFDEASQKLSQQPEADVMISERGGQCTDRATSKERLSMAQG